VYVSAHSYGLDFVWWWVYGLHPSSEEQNIKNIRKLKSQRFGSWLCFRPQMNGRGEEKRRTPILLHS
jgi:hypothetical protein